MRLFTTLFLAMVAVQEAVACSPRISPKVAFDPDTFIFEGRVVQVATDSSAYAGDWSGGRALEQEPGHEYPRAAALIVEPVAVVNAPIAAERFAIYPAGYGAACERIYFTADRLEQAYPVGERVLVVGKVHDDDPSGLRASAMPLTIGWPTDLLSRVSPLEEFDITTEPWSATVDRATQDDNSRAPEEALQRIEEGYDSWVMPDGDYASEEERVILAAEASQALRGRRIYEYERDLALLYAGRSNEERIGLLFKMRWYWFSVSWRGQRIEDCPYADLVQRYLPSERLRDRLGAYLLAWDLRPLPPDSACAEFERMMEAERQGTRMDPVD